MARLSRSAYQKAKLVSRDESLFRLRDHSEWGRRQSHEFYEYITSTSVRRLDRPGRGGEGRVRNPRVPLVTARNSLKDGFIWRREREGCMHVREEIEKFY